MSLLRAAAVTVLAAPWTILAATVERVAPDALAYLARCEAPYADERAA